MSSDFVSVLIFYSLEHILLLVIDERYALVIVLHGLGRCRLLPTVTAAGLLLHRNPAVVGAADKDDGDARSIQDAYWNVKNDGSQQNHEDLLDVGSDAQRQGAGELVADQTGNVERKRHDAGGYHAKGGPHGHRWAELGMPSRGDGGDLTGQAGQDDTLQGSLWGHLVEQVDGMEFEGSAEDFTGSDGLCQSKVRGKGNVRCSDKK